MFWALVTVAAVLTFVVYFGYVKPFKYWKDLGVPQGSPWFLLGDVWPTILKRKDIVQWLEWVYYKHPKSRYMGYYQFLKPMFFVKDPEVIKQLTIKDFDHFTDHQTFAISEDVEPLWSKNLFSLRGHRWKEMRGVLSGSFTSSKMKIMFELIREEAEKFVDYFNEEIQAGVLDLEMKDSFRKYATDVIASTSFGITVNSLKNPSNEFYRMGKAAINFGGFKTVIKFLGYQFCPWLLTLLKIRFFPAAISNFFLGIVNETIKEREEKGIVRSDMINILMEVKNGTVKAENKDTPDEGFAVVKESLDGNAERRHNIEITNQDITSQAFIFFFAGFETVSTAMSFTSYELAVNLDVQEKLRREIGEVYDKSNGKPSYREILEMKYLDMVISESLRKWPPAVVTDRMCTKPYILKSSGDSIPFKKADCLVIPTYSIHHDPEYYPDPEKLIPERFSEENRGKIKPYTYMPFGLGPRACIGSRFALLEIKMMLFYLLKSFEIVPTSKTLIPLKFDKSSVVFTPTGGFQLGLKKL
ncbi:cytochrome P450 9e2-like [Euwallacea fornicatus]|uniref:cytochrome P450 9e2-like n=1 Tax=Euwallacea fornicatus TaxID=995702 RepID=UPI00338E784F